MKIRKSVLKESIREVLREARITKPLSGPLKHILKQLPEAWSEDMYQPMIVKAIEGIAATQKQENLNFKQAFTSWSNSAGNNMGAKGKKTLFAGIKKSGDAYLQLVKNTRGAH